ncbi:DNA-3-methyladenine glycosylase family protein [Neptuniibacter sp. SY11_33]|uniref:DNA-3-methyladenine glycosylase family protein n=1 Tax=Neptuniibacter sp. SY11_33 TaxID=3398215 RepID=UPI0039F4B730
MNEQDIARGMQALALLDPDIKRAATQLGPPPVRHRPKGFETFLSAIVSQQISTKAAQAILERVTALMPEVTASELLNIDDQTLRDAGLSWRKIEYAKGLADAVNTGHFDIEGLDALDDKAAIASITNLRGFGRWSAEIYLMFSLKRPDIFPADDLAIQVALGRLKRLPDKPTPKQARDMVEHWAPWRSVGSLFLWHYYHGPPI